MLSDGKVCLAKGLFRTNDRFNLKIFRLVVQRDLCVMMLVIVLVSFWKLVLFATQFTCILNACLLIYFYSWWLLNTFVFLLILARGIVAWVFGLSYECCIGFLNLFV